MTTLETFRAYCRKCEVGQDMKVRFSEQPPYIIPASLQSPQMRAPKARLVHATCPACGISGRFVRSA